MLILIGLSTLRVQLVLFNVQAGVSLHHLMAHLAHLSHLLAAGKDILGGGSYSAVASS